MLRYWTDLVYTCASSSEVQIWPILLDVSEHELHRFADCLSEEERERAARFRYEKDRRPFVVCRGALRMLLGRYLGLAAQDVHFDYSARGKPRLAMETDIRFNVAHSGSLGVLAFTRGCELGVDVERVQPMKDMEEIAGRFFSKEERRELLSLPSEERTRAFFRCWTRKEAYIKATGEGLSAPLDQFQVTLRAGEAARFVHIDCDAAEASEWTLEALPVNAAYESAVAYRAGRKQVQLSRFDSMSVDGCERL